jgi:hypothetical protein
MNTGFINSLNSHSTCKYNIKAYLHKYKIIDDPMCPCKKGQKTVQHILFDCHLLEKEREKLKAVVSRTEKWPVSCNKLEVIYHKNSKEYIDNINWNVEQSSNNQ